MNDYERVAAVIRYLDRHRVEQPDLAEVAAQVGLSVSRIQRLFLAWAGVTPKAFLQCLTMVHARQLLRSGESVLGAALASGLSGPGRMHDLCVKLEAATPGEVKAGGQGWRIVYGFAESPFGDCLLAEGPRGICRIAFADGRGRSEAVTLLAEAWPAAALERDDHAATRLAAVIFRPAADKVRERSLRAWVQGTPFQVRVWRALLEVPEGSITTYGRLAVAIGQPGAARAVGTAVGGNPIAYMIPCHRVIRETGVVGGYRWGELRKRAMLVRECAAHLGSNCARTA